MRINTYRRGPGPAAIIGVIVMALLLFAVPSTWLVMLAAGNFGFSRFGFIDCLPLGIIVAMIASDGSSN